MVLDIHEATVAQLSGMLASGEISSRDLTQHYLERIDAIDRSGPTLRSVMEINPDAPDIAETLDRERAAGTVRGPLHGIPVLLKDNIDTGDRMLTTAGSLALTEHPAPSDAFLVTCLRAAGAVLLGKTNLSEWANFRSRHSSSGWSGRGGQTRNPYALDRSPSGSSSGSAVAVAADLCAVSVGTETDGSITSPASACGTVGIKPTVGLISRAGIIPIAETQDTAGPFGRTVADAAVLLGAMTGVDPRDPATRDAAPRSGTEYVRFAEPGDLRGLRIGIPRAGFSGFHPRTDAVLEAAVDSLRARGAEIIDPADLPSIARMQGDDAETTTLLYEFKAGLNAYLSARGASAAVESLSDVIRFNEEHAVEEMPFFGQDRFVKADACGPLTEHAYLEALHHKLRLARDEGIDAALRAHELDALAVATSGPAWLVDHVTGDHFVGGAGSSPAAVAGYPSISVPAGDVAGLPVGVLFFSGAWSEPTLLRIAAAFEAETRARQSPRFLQSVEV